MKLVAGFLDADTTVATVTDRQHPHWVVGTTAGLLAAVAGWTAATVGGDAVFVAVGVALAAGGLLATLPRLSDRLVDRRGHLVVGGGAVAVVAAATWWAAQTPASLPGELYALVTALFGVLLCTAGEGALADRRVRDGTVLARADTTVPRYRRAAVQVPLSAGAIWLVGVVLGSPPGPAVVAAGVIPTVLLSDGDGELVVIEEGVVLGRSDDFGGYLLPWWALSGVDHDDDATVSITQSLPVPLPRRRVTDDAATARSVADAARRARRR